MNAVHPSHRWRYFRAPREVTHSGVIYAPGVEHRVWLPDAIEALRNAGAVEVPGPLEAPSLAYKVTVPPGSRIWIAPVAALASQCLVPANPESIGTLARCIADGVPIAPVIVGNDWTVFDGAKRLAALRKLEHLGVGIILKDTDTQTVRRESLTGNERRLLALPDLPLEEVEERSRWLQNRGIEPLVAYSPAENRGSHL